MYTGFSVAVVAGAALFGVGARAADLVDTAIAAGNLKTFVAAVKAAGFTEALRNTGPYTVFAPSDEAFSHLPPGTWEALIKDKARLAQVITYHVIPGKTLVADVKPGMTKTLQGAMLRLRSDNGMVTVDEATVTQSDMQADNGVLHMINAVALPR
ncbi:MAG: fasciclin domain-containing protein [Herminiimonas sp.]|nr:fasciclin domain-containing protein [Herminiimonas sp.]